MHQGCKSIIGLSINCNCNRFFQFQVQLIEAHMCQFQFQLVCCILGLMYVCCATLLIAYNITMRPVIIYFRFYQLSFKHLLVSKLKKDRSHGWLLVQPVWISSSETSQKETCCNYAIRDFKKGDLLFATLL
jgi:hypothetical protein